MPHHQQLFVYAAYVDSEHQGWLVVHQSCFTAHLALVAFLHPQRLLSCSQHSLDQHVPSSLQVLQNDIGTQTDLESHPYMGQPGDYHQECQSGSRSVESHEDQHYEDSQQTNYYGSMPEDIPHGSLDDEEAYYQGDEEEYDQDDEEEYYQGDEEEYNQDDDEAYYQGDEEEYDQDDEEADYQEGEQQSDTTAAMNTFAASLQGFRGTAGQV